MKCVQPGIAADFTDLALRGHVTPVRVIQVINLQIGAGDSRGDPVLAGGDEWQGFDLGTGGLREVLAELEWKKQWVLWNSRFLFRDQNQIAALHRSNALPCECFMPFQLPFF